MTIWGCNHTDSKVKDSGLKEIIINEKFFMSEFDNFINALEAHQKDKIDSILLKMYINQNTDTIISFTNFQPYETVNLVAVNRYKSYKIYIYARQDLWPSLQKIVDISNGHTEEVMLKPIDEIKIDPFRSYTYDLKESRN